MEGLVVNGLDRQPLASIANIIAELGFNCVRLPFALDTVHNKTTNHPPECPHPNISRYSWILRSRLRD